MPCFTVLYLIFWQSSFPNLSCIEGIPIEFISLLLSVAAVVKDNKDLGCMKALKTALSMATGVIENRIEAPRRNPDSLSNPLDLVSPLTSATPMSKEELEV